MSTVETATEIRVFRVEIPEEKIDDLYSLSKAANELCRLGKWDAERRMLGNEPARAEPEL